MKEKILEYLGKYPGARKRDIASELHVWVASKELSKALYELLDEGHIGRKLYKDPANMEFYDKWYTIKDWN